MIYLAVLCIIIVFILFFKIDISIEYLRKEQNDNLVIGLFKKLIKIDIPFVDVDKKEGSWGIKFLRRFRTKKDKNIDERQKSRITFSQMRKQIEAGKEFYYTYQTTFNRAHKYLKRKIECSNFTLNVNFGVGDAAITGVTTGLIWGILYNILSILSNIIEFKHTDIKINPDFNDAKIDIELKGIFAIRIVHIINVLFVILFSLIDILLKKAIKGKVNKEKSKQNLTS